MNIMNRNRVIVLIMAVLFMVSCAGLDTKVCGQYIMEKDNGTTVSVVKDQAFCIKLPAVMSTGFGWSINKISANLKETGKPLTESPEKGKIGAAEFQIFRLIASETGAGEIELSYMRPWKKSEPPAKKFYVKVDIR
jgi:predicted secreted protein